VCKHGSQGVVSVPLTGNGLKVVDKRSDLAFIYIKVNVRPFAELVNEVNKGYHVFDRVGDERAVVRVPFAGNYKL